MACRVVIYDKRHCRTRTRIGISRSMSTPSSPPITPVLMVLCRNPQQVMAMQKQAMMQQQMRRDPSEMGINGQRPRTPSSGDNAPSPSKRPRIEGHPGMMMMQNGRSQQMLDQNNSSPNALLMQGGVPPGNLTPEQLAAFQNRPHQVQQKSLDVYAQNLKHSQQHQNMNKPIMPGQGSPMMQAGMDLNAVGAEYFGPQMHMRAGMPNGNGVSNGGNHALQDYQMQLMLLEQQNKKRLLMARQEQETPRGPDGQPGMPGTANFVGPSGMSPSGSRSGPSPGPNEQGKRGSPKMGQGILPASPMPDGNMPQARGSPAASMTLGNNMQGDMFQMKNMNEGMAVMGSNSNMLRQPPSSHPTFNGQFNPQQMAAEMQRRNMPNGNWQQGPQGQVPMMQPQAMSQPQQPAQMGTPQQRGNMPPPSGPPAGAAANGRSGSPAPPAAPATPLQTNKANPKGKKDAKDRKVSRCLHEESIRTDPFRFRNLPRRIRQLAPSPLQLHRLKQRTHRRHRQRRSIQTHSRDRRSRRKASLQWLKVLQQPHRQWNNSSQRTVWRHILWKVQM